MNELGYYVTRIEEEHLWEAKQLGAHSPQVLLNTLVYFNTKYFMLRTVEDHQKLSFTHIMKHWKKAPGQKEGQKSVILRYYPPAKKGKKTLIIPEKQHALIKKILKLNPVHRRQQSFSLLFLN